MLRDCDISAATLWQLVLRLFAESRSSRGDQDGRPDDLNVQVPDLLAQGIAIDAQKVGGADLVAAGRGQSRGQQRIFHLAQHPVIEARRRQAVREARKVARQVAFDRRGQVVGRAAVGVLGDRGLGQFGFDDRQRDDLVRIERREAPREIFQFANIARPLVFLQPLSCALVDLLARQPFALGDRKEMADQVGHVLGTLAQAAAAAAARR